MRTPIIDEFTCNASPGAFAVDTCAGARLADDFSPAKGLNKVSRDRRENVFALVTLQWFFHDHCLAEKAVALVLFNLRSHCVRITPRLPATLKFQGDEVV